MNGRLEDGSSNMLCILGGGFRVCFILSLDPTGLNFDQNNTTNTSYNIRLPSSGVLSNTITGQLPWDNCLVIKEFTTISGFTNFSDLQNYCYGYVHRLSNWAKIAFEA